MTYLFEFALANGKNIYLTSSNEIVKLDGKKYLPNSGLSLKCINKDGPFIEASIKGFFEEKGIDFGFSLEDSKLVIYYSESSKILSLEFFKIKSDLISFELYYFSKSIILKRTISGRISRKCRAILGDSKCKIDISSFLEQTKILSIDKNKIIIYKCSRPDGYYNGGRLKDLSGNYSEIVSYSRNEIIIRAKANLEIGMKVILYPSCDKTFSSCLSKFDNAINFRGEPFIGE